MAPGETTSTSQTFLSSDFGLSSESGFADEGHDEEFYEEQPRRRGLTGFVRDLFS